MSIEADIPRLLGKYKVIGDTTYGLGYNDAAELTYELLQLFKVYSQRTEKIADLKARIEMLKILNQPNDPLLDNALKRALNKGGVEHE